MTSLFLLFQSFLNDAFNQMCFFKAYLLMLTRLVRPAAYCWLYVLVGDIIPPLIAMRNLLHLRIMYDDCYRKKDVTFLSVLNHEYCILFYIFSAFIGTIRFFCIRLLRWEIKFLTSACETNLAPGIKVNLRVYTWLGSVC